MTESKNLYAQFGIRDFATSTEIAERLSQIGDEEADEVQSAILILSDYTLKNAYDMILEAWNNSDRLLPRFASPESAIVVKDVARRVGFDLTEIHTNTYQVRMKASQSYEDELADVGISHLAISVGSRKLVFAPASFVAHKDRVRDTIVLETKSSDSNSILTIPDAFVQNDTQQGDEGILVQLKQDSMPSQRVCFAILNQSQLLAAPLAAGEQYLFSKSNKSIAASFKVRNSTERIRQLVRGFYQDLANLVFNLDSRIGQQATLKSFLKYCKRDRFGV